MSDQVEIDTCPGDVPPEHLKTGNVVGALVRELKAQFHDAEAPRWI